ncbi:nucleotidyltransferase domain-containing protein [Herbiconiux daphne]|uniref:Nucleotidyltransferase domain-containing protein n=1 Tax=Herbiconiux daphne TaxID=2970914 RepID=A0ABT2GZR0_9MICO|nr:nucleotidyltransferase domain-containing protein [Herbiconiux daphne]MCS5733449.1 nucleotidyltransferase domain-containing protein [Herbiconiux daphne]
MRAIPPPMDAAIVAEIDRRLLEVSDRFGVRIPWAIESGSRAWGFPSPDSDYDCRFLYRQPPDRYLSLWAGRDVIETPLDAIFDVNGWDIAKAVRLVTKGNATALEWLRSPIVYSGSTAFRDEMLAFAERVVERSSIGRHYLHVAVQQRAGAQTLKRIFYVLRPAMALRWLRAHPGAAVPPMDLPTMMADCEVAPPVARAIAELMAVKAVTRELGTGAIPPILSRFIDDEIDAGSRFDAMPLERDAAWVRREADAFFRGQLARK